MKERQQRGATTSFVLPHALLCFQIADLAASESAVLTKYGLPVSPEA